MIAEIIALFAFDGVCYHIEQRWKGSVRMRSPAGTFLVDGDGRERKLGAFTGVPNAPQLKAVLEAIRADREKESDL